MAQQKINLIKIKWHTGPIPPMCHYGKEKWKGKTSDYLQIPHKRVIRSHPA